MLDEYDNMEFDKTYVEVYNSIRKILRESKLNKDEKIDVFRCLLRDKEGIIE